MASAARARTIRAEGASNPAAAAGLRPRDAGTLLLVDESSPDVRLLLGRRAAGHVFMPGKFVFPGGRVEPADRRLAARLDPQGATIDRLLVSTGARFDRRRAGAVALAAIRETFEEAGLMVGAPGPASLSAGGPAWRAFAAAGIVPRPADLVPVARAITPPGAPRRFDARFFCVSAEAIAGRLVFEARADTEFDALGWFTLDEVRRLDLARITLQVLSDIDAPLRNGSWRDRDRPMPFYRFFRQRLVRDLI